MHVIVDTILVDMKAACGAAAVGARRSPIHNTTILTNSMAPRYPDRDGWDSARKSVWVRGWEPDRGKVQPWDPHPPTRGLS